MRNLLVSWRGCAAFLVVCLYVSACADTEQNPNSGNTFTDVLTTTGSTSDDEHGGTADGNGTEGDDTGAETGTDGTSDLEGTTTTTGDTGDDDLELPDDFNEECESNVQCSTGFCIEGPDGKVCTMGCITSCPTDWECEGVTNFGGDITYICVPKFTALCSECTKDSDCGGTDSRCVDVPPEGTHCARSCSLEEPCPTGYVCKAFDDQLNLCQPVTGSCICSHDILGSEEDCFEENNFGICKGTRSCDGPGGWSECSAGIPTPEVCDGKDNDCDSEIDEGTGGQPCQVKNEFGTCLGINECAGAAGAGCTAQEPAAETCGDAIDNNCNNQTDEEGAIGCTDYFQDIDKDGLGNSVSSKCLCVADGNFTAVSGGDCNDLNPNVGAGKPEVCNTLDDDCDGDVDPENSVGCVFFYKDVDGDGKGQSADAKCLCNATKQYTSPVGGDCDDNNPEIGPGHTELCNAVDDNCNGVVDEANAIGCKPYLKDGDDDGYGVTSLSLCLCAASGDYKSLNPGDCNDNDATIHPGGLEICDGVDNSCNGIVDEDCDKDSDGYCNALKPLVGNPFSCPKGGGDCVDFDPDIHPNAAEICDEIDNDCDAEIDEGVQAPCGGCSNVCIMGAGPDSEVPFEEENQVFDGAGKDDDGNIVLDKSSIQLNMIWVANSGEGTISKINTATGDEVARYNLCGDPSRTSVDSLGNAWIACRGEGQVIKVALSPDDCVDQNGNGTIETSSDTNGNGIIDGGEMLAAGTDECRLFAVQPDGGGAVGRAMGVDKDDHGWAGMWTTKRLWKVNGETGEIMKSINIPTNPYGLAFDQKGTIWIAGRGTNQLVKVDPNTGSAKAFHPGVTFSPYGMTIDENGRIWLANCCSNHAAHRFDPVNESWASVGVNNRPRGISADGNGFVYIANDQSDKVHKIDINSMKVVGTTNLGGGHFPIGMAVDFDGKVWAINHSNSSATRIEPSDMSVLFTTKTGPKPYTYSDMTGFQQKTIVAPKGSYRHTFKGWANQATQWMQVGLEINTPPGTSADLRVRVADEKADLPDALWTPFFGPFPPALPTVNLSTFGAVIGRYMEVEVLLFAKESDSTPILKSIDIVAAPF